VTHGEAVVRRAVSNEDEVAALQCSFVLWETFLRNADVVQSGDTGTAGLVGRSLSVFLEMQGVFYRTCSRIVSNLKKIADVPALRSV
jgi:hypothetical protein